jgi:hypothetical protein
MGRKKKEETSPLPPERRWEYVGTSRRLSWPGLRITITPHRMTDEEIDRLLERVPHATRYFRRLIPSEEE